MSQTGPRSRSSSKLASSTPKQVSIRPWHALVEWQDLPHWQQDNKYILSGYRQASSSYRKSIESILSWHTETVNIWSHLIPALFCLPLAVILYHLLNPRYEQASNHDVLAFGLFFLGVALCLGMSATYHTISNHSPYVNKIGNQLDYVGIVLLIAGSFVPSVYYGFWCDQKLQIAYWTMIVSLGIGCMGVSVLKRFRTPSFRKFRAGMFVAMGLSAIFPVFHGLKLYGFHQMRQQIGLSWLVLQGFLYVLGAVIYAARIPERRYPRRFDFIGSSHQIFHFLVVCAAVSHLVGLLKAFDYRHTLAGHLCM